MLKCAQRSVGLVALLSMNLVGSEGDGPYFQADDQPRVYVGEGVSQHLGAAWLREGDTLTIKPLAGQTPASCRKLEIGHPKGTIVLDCGVRAKGVHLKTSHIKAYESTDTARTQVNSHILSEDFSIVSDKFVENYPIVADTFSIPIKPYVHYETRGFFRDRKVAICCNVGFKSSTSLQSLATQVEN